MTPEADYQPELEWDKNNYLCTYCNGTGEGMYDGSRCGVCRGTGGKPLQNFRNDDDYVDYCYDRAREER